MNETVTLLDVTPIEPKHRFDTIMGAYSRLAAGAVLELVMDHEPECLYYTLLATRGDDAFEMEYLESGPVVWRVRVHKRREHPEDSAFQESDAPCCSR